MKRIVTIQDISCVGKCSLTVALPIISAMGIECAVLPTSVLSTHTMFKNFTFRDLTDDIAPIAAHWKAEKIGFDAIYTGYLGSFEQLKLISGFIDEFRTPENLVFIDPVMADNGKLYPGFTPDNKYVEILDVVKSVADTVDIADAKILVSGGRGVGSEENFKLLQDLADVLGGTVSCSRAVVENGWLPVERQVGQTGKTVRPNVYFAIGISGAIQHVAGMEESDIIVAINKDETAPIFDVADYGLVGDLNKIVPQLTEMLKAELAEKN